MNVSILKEIAFLSPLVLWIDSRTCNINMNLIIYLIMRQCNTQKNKNISYANRRYCVWHIRFVKVLVTKN